MIDAFEQCQSPQDVARYSMPPEWNLQLVDTPGVGCSHMSLARFYNLFAGFLQTKFRVVAGFHVFDGLFVGWTGCGALSNEEQESLSCYVQSFFSNGYWKGCPGIKMNRNMKVEYPRRMYSGLPSEFWRKSKHSSWSLIWPEWW